MVDTEPTTDLPKESKKPNEEKERWLKSIQEHVHKGKPIVYQEEIELAREIIAKFKCPINFHPYYCDFSPCPNEEQEAECKKIRKMMWLIYKVEHNKIRVLYRTMAVRMP